MRVVAQIVWLPKLLWRGRLDRTAAVGEVGRRNMRKFTLGHVTMSIAYSGLLVLSGSQVSSGTD